MKKYIALFFLICSIMACAQWQSPQQLATQTALAATATAVSWTKTPTPTVAITPTFTPTIDYTAELAYTVITLLSGPGETYDQVVLLTGNATIIGQAYSCAWFKLVSKSNPSQIGWARADKLKYTVKCSDVDELEIPPTPYPSPTQSPLPTATKTRVITAPNNPPVTCQINSNIRIDNRSDGPATLYLKGPGNFTFNLPLGPNTVKVCSGTYNYVVYGKCNGTSATGTGKISDGDDIYFYCS